MFLGYMINDFIYNLMKVFVMIHYISLQHVLGGGCPHLFVGDETFDEDIEFVNMTWFETPSVVHDGAGNIGMIG